MANRVLLNASGLKISKPGINVLTATAAGDFAFVSDYRTLPIRQTGTVSVPARTSITHEYNSATISYSNDGYTPLVVVAEAQSGVSEQESGYVWYQQDFVSEEVGYSEQYLYGRGVAVIFVGPTGAYIANWGDSAVTARYFVFNTSMG